MRKHRFLSSLVIFVAGFALSAVVDGRRLASLAQGTPSNQTTPEVAAQATQKPSTSQKWEYRVVTKNIGYIGPKQVDINFELNRLVDQGFEVCWVAQSGTSGATILTIVARRPQ